jgi:hypothetical protein
MRILAEYKKVYSAKTIKKYEFWLSMDNYNLPKL